MHNKSMMVLGGSGFIGRHVIQAAVRSGWRVSALARSDDAAATIAAAGAIVIKGNADNPSHWLREACSAELIIDLIQPARPKRLGRQQMRKISLQRQLFTQALVDALLTLSADQRPHLISVSGIDDLSPDKSGCLSANSKLRGSEYGFNTIGIPVRKIIERSSVQSSFVYLGSVYGPGGPFGNVILPAVAAGKWKNFGAPSDRMILVHVDDVAQGLVCISSLDQARASGQSFVLTDTQPVTMTAFCTLAATLMGASAPDNIPKWLATLVAGKPIVETTLHVEGIQPTFSELPACNLIYPSYRVGLPATLQALGLAVPKAALDSTLDVISGEK